MTRRRLLALAAVRALPGVAAPRFRYALCNETLQEIPFPEQCRMARKIGYQGIEIMPGTLAEDPAKLPTARRAEVRRVMESEGIRFAGLHNLLGAPHGLHATTADRAVYRRTWDHMRALIGLCGDLGGGVMVLGSGKQRNAEAGMRPGDAVARLSEGLAGVAASAAQRGATILLEPLAPGLSNIVNTLEEAVAVVHAIGSAAVNTIFDVHNTAGEKLAADQLVDRYIAEIRHVHLNEMDGKRPGLGSYDFPKLLRALERNRYQGWLSLEVFQFAPSGPEVARAAREYLKEQEGRI
jgi:D-psicose/D-tagatose/L-ribulose 3-epimerase